MDEVEEGAMDMAMGTPQGDVGDKSMTPPEAESAMLHTAASDSQAVIPNSKKKVGIVTKVPRKPSRTISLERNVGNPPAAWGPGHWNRFNRDLPSSRPKISLSKANKLEKEKRQQWEEEKKLIRERDARAQQIKQEAAEAAEREMEDQKKAKRRLALEARVRMQKEKIAKAGEERQRREEDYQNLLIRTREKGLLHERLEHFGSAFVESVEHEKVALYQDTESKARKVSAKEIQSREELHPAFKQMQRRQMAANQEREARRAHHFVTTKSPSSGSYLGSGFNQFSLGTGHPLPGTGLANYSGIPSAPNVSTARKAAAHQRQRTTHRPLMVDRASSPILLPGVEILVNGEPYVTASSTARQHHAELQDGDMAGHGHTPRESDANSHYVQPHLQTQRSGSRIEDRRLTEEDVDDAVDHDEASMQDKPAQDEESIPRTRTGSEAETPAAPQTTDAKPLPDQKDEVDDAPDPVEKEGAPYATDPDDSMDIVADDAHADAEKNEDTGDYVTGLVDVNENTDQGGETTQEGEVP